MALRNPGKSIAAAMLIALATPLACLAALASEGDDRVIDTSTLDPVSPSLETIQRFVDVYRLVKGAYVEPVTDDALIESAIHGMLAGLDPHSGYLDADSLEVLTDDTLGAYDGLGVEVLSGEGLIQVIGAMPDSPAASAGLKAGDYITHVDGTAVDRGNLEISVGKLRGRPGTAIKLTVARDGEDAPRQIELTRARIKLSSVQARVIEPGFGYVLIAQCQQETIGELRSRLTQLEKQSGGLRGLVLDLRGNPGGTLDSAVAVSDLFLADGRIVSVEGRALQAKQTFDARPGSRWEALPLAVLIDEGTASAAEIIAAALKSHGRAVVLGRRSYGKGSVQNVFAVDDAHAVRLTTARYFTADGKSIQADGVHPDIELGDFLLSTGGATTMPMLVERDLPGHLSATVEPDADGEAATNSDDYAIHQAIITLKSQTVLARRGESRTPSTTR